MNLKKNRKYDKYVVKQMRQINQRKNAKIYLIIFIILFIILTSFLLYLWVFLPSYLSYSVACSENSKEILERYGATVSGKITVGQSCEQECGNIGDLNKSKITIEFNNAYFNKKVYKHEYCHLKQIYQDRFDSCDESIKKYFDEVECYTVEKLPDFIYSRLYWDISDVEFP